MDLRANTMILQNLSTIGIQIVLNLGSQQRSGLKLVTESNPAWAILMTG